MSRGEDIDLLPDLATTSVSSSQSRVQQQNRNMHHWSAGGCRCGPAAGLLPSFDLSWYLLLVMVHIELPSWSCSEQRLQAADALHENPCLEHLTPEGGGEDPQVDPECLFFYHHMAADSRNHCTVVHLSFLPLMLTLMVYFMSCTLLYIFKTAVLPVSTDDPRGHCMCRLQCQSRRSHLG